MSTNQGLAVVRTTDAPDDEAMWRLIATGNLAGLTDAQKTTYYLHLCESIGVNPATQPFEYMEINKKYILYAKPTLTDQLRKIHGVSVVGRPTVEDDGAYITAEVTLQDATGRTDFDIGVVFVGNIQGEQRANGRMKSLTKAKRRATLRICGLSALDESEVETIPGARPVVPFPAVEVSQPERTVARSSPVAYAQPGEVVDPQTGEILDAEVRDVTPPVALGWTEFWPWSRALGLNGPRAVEGLIGRPIAGLTPADLQTMIDAARAQADQPPENPVNSGGSDVTNSDSELPMSSVDMRALHADINAKLKQLSELPPGTTAHGIAHDIAVVKFDLFTRAGQPSLTMLDAAQLRELHRDVGPMKPDELVGAWQIAVADIADRLAQTGESAGGQ